MVTLGDREQRFAFLTSRRSDEGYTPQATIVAGPRWAIGIQDPALAERVGRGLGGELHKGTIGIPT